MGNEEQNEKAQNFRETGNDLLLNQTSNFVGLIFNEVLHGKIPSVVNGTTDWKPGFRDVTGPFENSACKLKVTRNFPIS
jgi:hypothetical protein